MSTNIGVLEGTIRLNDQFTANLKHSMSAMLSVGAVLGVTAKLFHDISREVIEDAANHAQLVAVLESTKRGSEDVADALEGQALAMSRLSTFTDDAIVKADTVALKFTHIGGEIFPRVTQAAMDMAARTGGDVAGAMEGLGRAIDDPIRGLTVLRRQGVTFTDEQKEQVKILMSHGELVKAQGILLDALATKYGGAAKAARDTMGGALTALGNSWDQLMETMGKDSTGPFRDTVEFLITGINKVNDNWHGFWRDFNIGVLSMVQSGHELGDAIYDVTVGILGLAAAIAKATGGPAQSLMEMQAGVMEMKKTFDAKRTKEELALGDKIISQGKAQIKAQMALNMGIKITNEGLVRQTEESKAAGKALQDAFKGGADGIVAMNAGIKALQEGKGTDYAEALVDVMTKFPDASKKVIDQLVEMKLKSDASAKGFSALKDLVQKSMEGVNLDKLTGVINDQNEARRRYTEESLSDAGRFYLETQRAIAAMKELGFTTQQIEQWVKQNGRATAEFTDETVKLSVKWIEIGQVMQIAFDGVEGKLGEVGRTMGKVIEIMASGATATEKWAAALDAVFQMVKNNNVTAGGFGGKGAGNFAAQGSMIGTVIGAIVGSMFAGVGAVAGAQIGAAAGGIIGSFIKKGAQEAIGQIELSTSGLDAMVRKSEGGLGSVISGLGVSIEQAINQLLGAIGGTLMGIPPISVKVRDGIISVWVGEIVGRFKEIGDAVSFAVAQILKQGDIIGLAPEVKAALENTKASSLEGLQADLQVAMDAVAARIGEVGTRFVEAFRKLSAEIEQAHKLGVADDALLKARKRLYDQTVNQILGIDSSAADAIEALGSLNRGIAEINESATRAAEQGLADAQAKLDALMERGPGFTTGADGRIIGMTQDMWDDAVARAQAAVQRYQQTLDEIPQALNDTQINMGIFNALYRYLQGSSKYAAEAHKYALMRVEIEFALIKAQLEALGKWEEFADMFNDAFAAAKEQAAHAGKGGGGRGAQRREDQASIRSEIEGLGLGSVSAALRETGTWFDDITKRIKAAGFGSAETARLMALAAEEMERRQQEIRQGVIDNFRAFMGEGADPLSQLGEKFNKLKTDITDAGFGADRTAFMIARLTAEYQRQADALIQQGRDAAMKPHQEALDTVAGIGKQQRDLIDAIAGFDASRDALKKLADEARAAGRSTDFLAGDLAKLDAAQAVVIHNMGVDFIGSLTALGAVLPSDLVMELAKAQWQLAKAQAISAALALAAAGAFDGMSVSLEDILGIINGATFEASNYFPKMQDSMSGFSSSVDTASTAVDDLAKRFASAKNEIADLLVEMASGQQGVVTARSAFDFMQQRYRETVAAAKGGDLVAFENVSKVSRDYLSALGSFSPSLLSAEFPRIQTDLKDLLNVTTVHEGNVLTSDLFKSAHLEQLSATNTGFQAVVAVGTEQAGQQAEMASKLSEIAEYQKTVADKLTLDQLTEAAAKRSG